MVQVAAVQPHADALRQPQLADHVDRGAHAVQRVVRVHQERRAIRVILGERPEGVALGRERLDERVRHRPRRPQAVPPRGLHVRGGREPHDRARARHGHRRLPTVRAPEREVHQPRVRRRDAVPRRLGCDRRVQRHLVQQERLHELRDRERRGHLQHAARPRRRRVPPGSPRRRRRTATRGTPRCRAPRSRSSAGTPDRPRRTRTSRALRGTPRGPAATRKPRRCDSVRTKRLNVAGSVMPRRR